VRWSRETSVTLFVDFGGFTGAADGFAVAMIGVSGGAVAAAVLLAAYLPARRAAGLDPAATLRAE